MVSASGCINQPAGNNSQGQNQSPSPSANTSAGNVVINVNYQGTWNGTISDNTGNRTVQGNANNRYNLGPNPGTVSVTFRKTDNSTQLLLVQIIQGNKVIESQSTNETFGVVSITHVF